MRVVFRKLAIYRQLLGFRGFWLAVRSKLSKRPVVVAAQPPQFSHPVYLRLKSSDLTTCRKVLLDTEYEFQLTREPAHIIDAGANVGLASVFFARKHPHARIIAIEPESSNFDLLRKNVAPYPNIVPLRAALWNKDTDLELVDPGIGHWGFRAQSEGGTTAGRVVEKVPGVTINGLMASHGLDYIDILKIDIEGGEKELFAHPPEWIDKVGVIMIELHDRYEVGCSRNFFLATRVFEFEAHRGENVLLARRSYVKMKDPAPVV